MNPERVHLLSRDDCFLPILSNNIDEQDSILILDIRWMKLAENPESFCLHQMPPWWNIARTTFPAYSFNESSSLMCFFLRNKIHHSFRDLWMFSSWKKHPQIHEECHHVPRDEIVSFWKKWRSTELGLSIILHHGIFQLAAFRESSGLLFSYLKTGVTVAKWSFNWGSPSLENGCNDHPGGDEGAAGRGNYLHHKWYTAPVEVGSLSHYLQGFCTYQAVQDFFHQYTSPRFFIQFFSVQWNEVDRRWNSHPRHCPAIKVCRSAVCREDTGRCPSYSHAVNLGKIFEASICFPMATWILLISLSCL